eukprot:842938_1
MIMKITTQIHSSSLNYKLIHTSQLNTNITNTRRSIKSNQMKTDTIKDNETIKTLQEETCQSLFILLNDLSKVSVCRLFCPNMHSFHYAAILRAHEPPFTIEIKQDSRQRAKENDRSWIIRQIIKHSINICN